MPVALGALTAYCVPEAPSKLCAGNSWWRLVWAPFLVVLTFLCAALLFHLEGLICVLIICPAFLIGATLTRGGVSGVRHATFERGVEFIETVDEWVPLQRLSFSIVPNTATIPPTTFDEHVIVGGRFFDVLRGTYELQPAGPGRTRLVLHSRQRLSTHLNWYAGLWTGFVMSEIQSRILTVLKRRCEAPRPVATQ